MKNSPHSASPEGGSTGLERTQDQLEIALREGDESSSGGRLPSSQVGSDDRGLTSLDKELVEALKVIADGGDWYGEMRFAEDTDADFLLRVMCAARRIAREAFAKAEATATALPRIATEAEPSAALRRCGFCTAWVSRPCGEGCVFDGSGPTWAELFPLSPTPDAIAKAERKS